MFPTESWEEVTQFTVYLREPLLSVGLVIYTKYTLSESK